MSISQTLRPFIISVMPAKAGISGVYKRQLGCDAIDPSLRWGDEAREAAQ